MPSVVADKRVRLGKLTRPRLHQAVIRDRLIGPLDQARASTRMVCVIGPPGAGKTTLVASWLEARGIQGIWYQVDSGDRDLATFFYYLGEAARAFARKGQGRLPLLAAEYLQDAEGFSRRFFREMSGCLPDGAALVLDNYQEVAGGSALHDLIAQAVDELPDSITLVVISRRDLPSQYARLIANERLACIGWDALQLTLDEARAIAVNRDAAAAFDVEALHSLCGGWAAGFTLILEGSRKHDAGADALLTGSPVIFDYFAAQIFERLPRSTQQALVATAFLPHVPLSMAEALTGNADVAAILEDLYRRHLFIDRRPGVEKVYAYHALFRDFLRARAQEVLGSETCRRAMQRAAALLCEAGVIEEAFGLYVDALDWEGACKLVLEQADELHAQGRSQTLREWIGLLPRGIQEKEPWLTYWLGAALMSVNQQEARAWLERAFGQFASRSDVAGQMHAASSIINSYFFEWSEWRQLDAWIEALDTLMQPCAPFASAKLEFDVCCSMLIATLYRRPGHPLLAVCADRVEALLDAELDVNRKATGATLLLTYSNLANRAERAHRTVERMQALVEHRDVTPLNRVWWYSRLTWYLVACARYEQVAGPTRVALDLIERHGLQGLRSATLIVNAHLALALLGLKDWKRAGEVIAAVEWAVQPSRPSDMALAAELRTHLLICKGELSEALKSADTAVQAAAATGMISLEVMQRALAMEVLAELGRHEEARAHARHAYALVRDTCLAHRETELHVIEAYMARAAGSIADCHALLLDALGGPEGQWRNGRLHGRIMSAMFAEALDAGIETARVRAVIHRLGLPPPPHASEKWPWPARIYCLGRFEVIVDDLPLVFGRKAPKKPLFLLKALIALGGLNVPQQELADALWPNEPGDAALQALDVTLRRARSLLAGHDSILVRDGRVSLNAGLCWVDVWQFERCLQTAEAAHAGAEGILDHARSIYRGDFLPMITEEPWVWKPRERLRAGFVWLVETRGRACEAAGELERAIECYRHGIEVDNLAEPFYQGLMRCYRALGRQGEGLTAYRRLRHLLSVVLGVAPSDATQMLARSLQCDNPAHWEVADLPRVSAFTGPAPRPDGTHSR